VRFSSITAISLLALVLSGCTKDIFDETGGIRVARSACPAVALPAHTADITLFNPPQSTDARAQDVTATITNLRGTCSEGADALASTVTFDVVARRTGVAGPREVVLPYYATVVRGGTRVVSKGISRIAIRFADGQERATASGQASARVDRGAATLPEEVRQKLTRKRKPTDPDASIDPMSDPATRAAVQAASFEVLVGFQLTPEQLAYNATR
jgi:hypothetical protein